MSRAGKVKVLQATLQGNTAALRELKATAERPLTTEEIQRMPTHELKRRHEQLRQKRYKETGVLIPSIDEAVEKMLQERKQSL